MTISEACNYLLTLTVYFLWKSSVLLEILPQEEFYSQLGVSKDIFEFFATPQCRVFVSIFLNDIFGGKVA